MKAVLLMLALLAAGCRRDQATPVACTMEFRTLGITVVDTAGAPIVGAEIDVVRRATGASIICKDGEEGGCVQPAAGADGRYETVHDGVPVAEGGEAFRVSAQRDSARAEAELTVGFDGCHIYKVEGPDTLRLES